MNFKLKWGGVETRNDDNLLLRKPTECFWSAPVTVFVMQSSSCSEAAYSERLF